MFKPPRTNRKQKTKSSPVQIRQRQLCSLLGSVTALGPWIRATQTRIVNDLGPNQELAHRITQLEAELSYVAASIRDQLADLSTYKEQYEQRRITNLSLEGGHLAKDGTFKKSLPF